MKSFRITDEATSNNYRADTVRDAVEKFIFKYDTADMGNGDSFSIRIYSGKKLDVLCSVGLVIADGKGGVKWWSILKR